MKTKVFFFVKGEIETERTTLYYIELQMDYGNSSFPSSTLKHIHSNCNTNVDNQNKISEIWIQTTCYNGNSSKCMFQYASINTNTKQIE